jgi:hypothetical protein
MLKYFKLFFFLNESTANGCRMLNFLEEKKCQTNVMDKILEYPPYDQVQKGERTLAKIILGFWPFLEWLPF